MVVIGKIVESFSPSADGFGFMWVILAVGGIAAAISVERFLYIVMKSGKGRKEFMANLSQLLKGDKLAEATSYAQNKTIPLAKCIYAVLKSRDKGEKGMSDALDEVFLTEAPRITRYMNLIVVCANVATLTGRLGTIYGLIAAFDAVANKPAAERPTALANGISVAMGTTFLGLVVAIPLLVVNGYLTLQATRLVEEMEEKSLKVMHIL